MLNIKSIFIIAIALAVISMVLFGSKSFGLDLSKHLFTIASAGVAILVLVILFKTRSGLRYALSYKNKKINDSSPIASLLGLQNITLRGNYILAEGSNKLVGHAYFRISNVPYLLDDLDKEKKMWYVGNFVRILSALNFPFEMIPRIMPVPAGVYLNQINKEIDDLKMTLSAEGSMANPRRQARLKYLERIATRLLEGEGTRDVSFLCHIMVEGKDESSLVKELEANAKTLMSALESGLNVRAERLTGSKMLEILREFFPATMRINPPKANRMLAWDLAYLIPLAKPKLPPLEKLLHGVYLGRTVTGAIVCLDINRYANPHIVVLGKSGYGKSTTVKTLISRFFDLYETSVLIIDYAGEYAPYVQSRNGSVINMQTSSINPFELGPATLTDRMRQLMDTFQKLSDLSLPQRNALVNYIAKSYQLKGFKPDDPLTWNNEAPTLEDVIGLMKDDLPTLKITKQLTLMALIERLQALSSGPLGIFRKSKFSITDLTQGFVCVDLSRVTSTIMKDMIAYTILQHIDSEMRLKGMRTGVRLVIVLDEAWKLCREEDSLPVTIIKEGRKYGYSLIVSSQDATADLAESILANAGTAIIHHTEHPKYLRFFEMSYGLTKQELSRIQNAPIGEALAKIGDDPRPFFVKVEMEEVEVQMQPSLPEQTAKHDEIVPIQTETIEKEIILPQTETLGNINTPIETLGPEQIYAKLSKNAKKLLRAVAKEPELNTTEYYEKLGLNAYQGNKARTELESYHFIEGVELPKIVGKGRYGRVLKLTKTGYGIVNQKHNFREGGTIHRHIINLIARKFYEHKIDFEYPIGAGKRVDLVIDRKIAVEVETRDFTESNITKNLEAGFEKVIVVCQTKQQAQKFRDMLPETLANDARIRITDVASLLGEGTI